MDKLIPLISPSINDTLASLEHIYPELALVLAFLLVIIAGLVFPQRNPVAVFALTLAASVAIAALTVVQLTGSEHTLFGGMIIADGRAARFKLIISLATILGILFIRYNNQLRQHSKGTSDLYAVLLALQLGLNLMVMSANLLMVYLSVEMVSVGSYILVGYTSASRRQTEAAMKYALFGAACSAMMLYGLSLFYGFTGSLVMYGKPFADGLAAMPPTAAYVAYALLFTGIGFKLSFVPVHFWSPDVYEGAPTPVTAFLSTAPKAAAFALLLRLMSVFSAPDNQEYDLNIPLCVIAIASMLIGNFGAIWQNNAKRMLAYSSIGHTGFMLMAAIAFPAEGEKALLFYLFIYTLMNMAAFMLVSELETIAATEDIQQYLGLGRHMPLLMICFTVVLVSLTGLPPTAGFTAKFLIFTAALQQYNASGSGWVLAVILTGAVSTVVSLFYYFRIPLNAFLKKSQKPFVIVRYGAMLYTGIVLAALLLILIVYPELLGRLL